MGGLDWYNPRCHFIFNRRVKGCMPKPRPLGSKAVLGFRAYNLGF